MTIKHGTIVLGEDGRPWIALEVKRLWPTAMLPKPGMYLFRGFWYDHGTTRHHENHRCYGKFNYLPKRTKIVAGRSKSSYLARKLLR